MTDPTLALRVVLAKVSDAEPLREMVGFTAQHLMEIEAESLTGAHYGQRSEERLVPAPSELRVPKLRNGSYFPAFLEPRGTAEKALGAVIQKAYVPGIPTRSVDDLVQSFGMRGISKSQVSRLCGEIDDKINGSSTDRWRVTGPISGSMPPTSRCTRAAASPALPSPSPPASTPPAGARCWYGDWRLGSGDVLDRVSGKASPTAACAVSTWWSPLRIWSSRRRSLACCTQPGSAFRRLQPSIPIETSH